MGMLAYENGEVMVPILTALQQECKAGEFVIYRHAFRWMRWTGEWHDGIVMPNMYEMFSLEQVLRERALTARYTFEHAAIVSEPAADMRGAA